MFSEEGAVDISVTSHGSQFIGETIRTFKEMNGEKTDRFLFQGHTADA